MKTINILFTVLLLVTLFFLQSFSASNQNLQELLIQNELYPNISREARAKAADLGLPMEIYLPQNVLIYPITIENGKPLYAVITNLAHPLENGYTAYYEDITKRYDLKTAKITYAQSISNRNNSPEDKNIKKEILKSGVLLVPDWNGDKVMAFDPKTGNLVDSNFIPTTAPALQSPKEAVLSPWGFITVSDQVSDLVQKFSTTGTYLGWFAPAGGVNNTILDNLRGHAYRSNKNLVVANSQGGNANAIVEFDSAGNYIGNFIAAGAGGLNSPFGILFRTSDVLVTHSSGTQGVRQYDLNGNYISLFAAISSFPQQIIELKDKTVAVANFQGTGSTGIRLYSPDGTFLRLLAGVTGNRGVFQLENGNFITTNATGIHEIDFTTGDLVRTIFTSTNLQFITLYQSQVPSITVVSPNGGEYLIIDQLYNITWNKNMVDTIKIEYSTNSGVDWLIITSGVPARSFSEKGLYTWSIPNTPSNNCILKISDINNPLLFDVSDSEFTIGLQSVTVTAPNGGDTLFSGQQYNITWNAVGIDTFKIDYSTDNGANWFLVTSGTPVEGSFVWTAPFNPSSNCLVKVSAKNNPSIYDISDSVFTIEIPLFQVSANYSAGWNLVSVPVIPYSDSIKHLYPWLPSPIGFQYGTGGYQPIYTISRGRGFWLKFPRDTIYTYQGLPIIHDSIDVATGWNITGSISYQIDTSTITSQPPGLKVSQWYGYMSGYFQSQYIVPGKGYWIKSNSSGKFIFSAPGELLNQRRSAETYKRQDFKD